MVEPIHHTLMGISPSPIEVRTRGEVKSGGHNVTYVTEEYIADGPVTRVSKSSVTVYDRFGQTQDWSLLKSTKEIFA